ncbi:MAG: hypothetical protein ABIJ86_17250 [Spirochaetota bacterium]
MKCQTEFPGDDVRKPCPSCGDRHIDHYHKMVKVADNEIGTYVVRKDIGKGGIWIYWNDDLIWGTHQKSWSPIEIYGRLMLEYDKYRWGKSKERAQAAYELALDWDYWCIGSRNKDGIPHGLKVWKVENAA